ncbi:hypothetical protein [Acaryochloris marina]|uniref:hypothetical protein n=1 Tax=Acaryochloris marina TaxID=155978 RepID=UPI0011D08F27|nr:hypothetical protein [Acaryochloris marina]
MSSENSIGKRTVVVLFDGLFAELRSSSSNSNGIEKLNIALRNNFNSGLKISISSKVFQHHENEEAYRYIKSFSDIGKLVIIGYSLGGRSAIKLSKELLLPEDQIIDLLIQIDSVKANNNTLPTNVTSGINYYQESTDFLEPQGVREMSGSRNINVETLLSDTTITHQNIDDNQYLMQIIIKEIDNIKKTQKRNTDNKVILNKNKEFDEDIIKTIEENIKIFE